MRRSDEARDLGHTAKGYPADADKGDMMRREKPKEEKLLVRTQDGLITAHRTRGPNPPCLENQLHRGRFSLTSCSVLWGTARGEAELFRLSFYLPKTKTTNKRGCCGFCYLFPQLAAVVVTRPMAQQHPNQQTPSTKPAHKRMYHSQISPDCFRALPTTRGGNRGCPRWSRVA